jgi:hypothetical protein
MVGKGKKEADNRLQSRIGIAAAELESLGKSPEQAKEMLQLLLTAAEGNRSITGRPIWDGWSRIQFWAAFQLACLCAWSLALQKGRQALKMVSIHALDYGDARERYQELKLIERARRGGQRDKRSPAIVEAVQQIHMGKGRIPTKKALRELVDLARDGFTTSDGKFKLRPNEKDEIVAVEIKTGKTRSFTERALRNYLKPR